MITQSITREHISGERMNSGAYKAMMATEIKTSLEINI